jgi:hyaluronan synthase
MQILLIGLLLLTLWFSVTPSIEGIWFILPFGLAGILSWGTWVVRRILSRRYRPLVNDFRTTTSVVVPSYREDPDILMRCLQTWLQENPNEVILVVDTADTEVLKRLESHRYDKRVRVIPFLHQGKRSALGVGIRAAQYEIIVLADSDTAWEPGLLAAVQMPFVDPKVGGVGTRQNAIFRESSIWRVVADWLINIRYLDYVPVESIFGGVACLSGRTAAYRRSVILPLIGQLEHEYFMGQRCAAGDDGRLTWLVLGAGYKTVYQSNARAWSMFPNQWKAFLKQRIRWSRNSYRCYLTAIYKGWLWRQPFVTQIRVLQILCTPITMSFGLLYILITAIQQEWQLLVFGIVWLFVGRGIRSLSHLNEHPKDVWLLPLVSIVVIYIALPIKLWAFVSMNRHGWLTRVDTSVGGEGQSEASLNRTTLKAASLPRFSGGENKRMIHWIERQTVVAADQNSDTEEFEGEAAPGLEINHNNLYQRRGVYDICSPDSTYGGMTEMEADLHRLWREVEVLRAECDILKKAVSIVSRSQP